MSKGPKAPPSTMKVRFTPQESPLPGVSCAPSKHFNSDRLQGVGVFKASAVRLVLDEGKTVGAAARDLDLTASDWIRGHTRWLHQIDRLSSLSSNRNGQTLETHIRSFLSPFVCRWLLLSLVIARLLL